MQSAPSSINKSDLNDLFGAALSDMKDMVKAKGPLLQIDNLPVLHCFPELMQRVFYELLDNAFNYGETPLQIRVRCVDVDDGYEVSFSTNIAETFEISDQVFLPLWRGKNSTRDNSGIGLAICRKIIEEKHHGKIWVDTSSPKYFTVRFTIHDLSLEEIEIDTTLLGSE